MAIIGKAHVILSEITIKDIQVSSSYVEIGDSGINVVVSGATANLSLNWRYTVSSWLVPIGISDSGTATVKVLYSSMVFFIFKFAFDFMVYNFTWFLGDLIHKV
jgi:hypothetical protein